MNVLVLTRYGRLGASSRVRFVQYLPLLEQERWHLSVKPFLPDSYIESLQAGSRSLIQIGASYAARMRLMPQLRSASVVWMEKEALPWLPGWLEGLLLGGRVPLVLDYDDAVFHLYDRHPSPWVQTLLGHKHQRLMRRAACVVAGNEYLADYARQSGAGRVELIPTVVDLSRYEVRVPVEGEQQEVPNVGWIGQRATATFLQPLAGVFCSLEQQGVARFTAIGIDAPRLGLPMRSVSWAEDSEAAEIAKFDVGIMPLADGPFERGKCGYKLIQYMACGLPVVASPVGVNQQIVEHGVNGFLARSPQEWEAALRTLAGDAALRHRMGAEGRRRVEQRYCLQVTGPRLVSVLRDAAVGVPTLRF